ncbi:MAG: ComF family protein [Bacteroidota bacterium]
MATGGFWQDLLHGLTDLVFPPMRRCAVCDRETGARLPFCRGCLERLPLIAPPICRRCGRMLRLCASADGTCRECARESFYFQQARAACLYEGPVREYLHQVKFHRSYDMAVALADLLAVFVREEGTFRRYQAVVPVPLHGRREAERGFNQAAVLARAVAGVLSRPLLPRAVVRFRPTETQSRLGRERRRDNVRDAFQAAEPGLLRGRRILLVDDIMTTGYTVSECARAILRAGAVEVGVLTLANGVLDDQWLAARNS